MVFLVLRNRLLMRFMYRILFLNLMLLCWRNLVLVFVVRVILFMFAFLFFMISCLSPVVCYRCGDMIAKDGVTSPRLVWSYSEALQYFHGDFFAVRNAECSLPCGHCDACKIRKRKEMSTRLVHEVSCHEHAIFLTLTYDDEHLPIGVDGHSTLCVSDVQRFLKRLRRHLEYVPKHADGRDHVITPIRYFAVGEYGSRKHRPHYHIMIFGWSPSDARFHRQNGDIVSFRSPQIEKLWTCGFSEFSGVSPYVAKYCARYVTKKIVSDWVLYDDQLPEFTLSSKRYGGIGALWCDKYGIDALRRRFCTYRLRDLIVKAAVPRYYSTRLRKTKRELWLQVRDDRIEFIRHNRDKLMPKVGEYEALVRSCECYLFEDNKRRKEMDVL